MSNFLTPIPQKQSILEQSFNFLQRPKAMHYRSTETRPEYVASGDVSIPIMLALLSLFQYLAPLRAMRGNTDEDLLLFFLQAPTIGFCLKIYLTVSLYNWRRIKNPAETRFLKKGDEEKFRKKTVTCLKLIAERCTYLTQLSLSQLEFEETRILVITDLLPKLNRLEYLLLGSWEYYNVHPSQFVTSGNEPRIANLLPTVFASNRNLAILSIYLTGDVGEFKTLLSQVSKSLRELTVHGKASYQTYAVGATNNTAQMLIDGTVMEIIASCAPRLTKLELYQVSITSGFFLHFSGFTNLRDFTLSNSKFNSDDPLEFQYLQEACGSSLQRLVFYQIDFTAAAFNENPFLALTGRLVRNPGTNVVTVSESLTNLLSFPALKEFQNVYSKETSLETACKTLHHLALPSLTKLDLSCYVGNAPTISFSALMEFVSQHRNLRILSLPSRTFENTGGLSMINNSFNLIGENLLDLREITLTVSFESLASFKTAVGSKEITFSSWKNLTKLEKLTGNFVNDNLLKIAGEYWRENFVHINLGSYTSKETSGYISDEGLDAFSKITSPPPSFFEKQKKNVEEYSSIEGVKPEVWRSRFTHCYLQYLPHVTDEGVAKFFKQLSLPSDNGRYDGLKGVSVAKTNAGILTCEALSLYPSIEDADFQGTKVDESCFNAIAKCTALTVLFFDNPNIRNVEAFSILAKSLPDLCYLDLYALTALTAADIDRLHELFAEQFKNSSLYIGSNHT